jgi:hypothetical protein
MNIDNNVYEKIINKIEHIKNNILLIKNNNINSLELLNNIMFIINNLHALTLDYNNNTIIFTEYNSIKNKNIDDKIYDIYLPYILYTQLLLQIE